MLTKIGNILIDEKKIPKYKNVSFYIFLAGLVLFFALPFMTDNIFITEKQVKNSEIFYNQFTFQFFNSELEKLKKDLAELNSNNEITKQTVVPINKINKKDNHLIDKIFMKSLFSPKRDKNQIESVEINSQRGERLKFIMINIIYNREINSQNNTLAMISLINHFSYEYKSNFYWLAKDIQFNFIENDLFFSNPNLTTDLLTYSQNKKIKEGQMIDFIINIDTVKLNFMNFLFKINGASSEIVDMDFHKIFIDNLSIHFSNRIMSTYDSFFNLRIKKNIIKIYSQISDLLKVFLSSFMNIDKHRKYENEFLYFIENLFENYFHGNEKLDTNHLLITKGYMSLLITSKNVSKENNIIGDSTRDKFKFLEALEKIIKIFSKSEIDLFRGDYNYLLFSSRNFVGVGIFLFVPLLMVIRIFYEILGTIYTIGTFKENKYTNTKGVTGYVNKGKNEKNNYSKIIAVLLISLLFQLLTFFHIEQINSVLNLPYEIAFYIIIGINFLISIILFFISKFNHKEKLFCDIIITFLFTINCFNFMFINYGFGLIMTVVFFPIEALFFKFSNRMFKFSVLGFVLYIMIFDKTFLLYLITNYVEHFNNVYPIYSTVIAMLISRMTLFLNMIRD